MVVNIFLQSAIGAIKEWDEYLEVSAPVYNIADIFIH